jgi:hypothetical protein
MQEEQNQTAEVIIDDQKIEMSPEEIQKMMAEMGMKKERPQGHAHFTKYRPTDAKRKQMRKAQRTARKITRQAA